MKKPRDMWTECLATLGLPKDSAWEDIQRKYRKLALEHHPDSAVGSQRASGAFLSIAAAYSSLRNLHDERAARSEAGLKRTCQDEKLRSLSIQEIAMRLQFSSSPMVRAAAVCLASEKKGPEARRLLIIAACDSDALVRSTAIRFIAEIATLADAAACLRAAAFTSRKEAGLLAVAFLKILRRTMRRAVGRAVRPLKSLCRSVREVGGAAC